MMGLRKSADHPTGSHIKPQRLLLLLCTAHCLPPLATTTSETMQHHEVKFNRNSLLLAVRRYSSAVKDMEQTVLLPSLLRDVSCDEAWDCDAAEEPCKDLYENYLMLKAIRNTVENGLVSLDDHKAKSSSALNKSLEPLLDSDQEALFRFHLRGLFSVMSDLTAKTQRLTDKYMDIVGN